MSFAIALWGLFSDVTVLSSIVVALLAYYITTFYIQVYKLPPGPFPLPLVGNLLNLRGAGYLFDEALRWSKKFGDPITIWIGSRPVVFASSKESFKDISGPLRNHLGGRMRSNLTDFQTRGFTDVAFTDFSPAWDTLRRVVHVAIRKYAQTDTLADLCATYVDRKTAEVLDGKDTATYDIVHYVEDVVNNVIGQSAYGAGFTTGDPMYEKLQKTQRGFEEEFPNGLPSDIMPILGWIFWVKERRARKILATFMEVLDEKYKNAAESYAPGSARHFTDALLAAREQFLKDDKDSSKYLTHENLRQSVFDIFGAGTATSRTVISYCLLTLANDKKLQDKLRQEIQAAVGDQRVLAKDRERLPLTDSFIQEVLRFYVAAPLALPRKALCDVTINGRHIPKDTGVMTNLIAVNRDKDIWGEDADQFKPERFLTATKDQIAKGDTSFGIGSRSCPGEKMAQADILYSVARTLQKVELSCPNGEGTADLTMVINVIFVDAKRQQIMFKRI